MISTHPLLPALILMCLMKLDERAARKSEGRSNRPIVV